MVVNKALKDWVRNGLKKGYSKDRLRDELLKAGYSENDISSALKETKMAPKVNPWIIGLVVVVVIVGAIYLFNALQTKTIVLEAERDFKSGSWGVKFEPFSDYIGLKGNGFIVSKPVNLNGLSGAFQKPENIVIKFTAKGE